MKIPASFRDPCGFLFTSDGVLYRQINQQYRMNYDMLMSTGLYSRLVKRGLLIAHDEVQVIPPEPEHVYKVIHPNQIPFISYPYEWCFSQLKDAALTTLAIQKVALEEGMSLKDASAYNIQFFQGRPVLIDTLSFEQYHEGKPWMAYRQFCQHFLAPLALMAWTDIRLSQLLRVHIDGIPLDMASRLLPRRTHWVLQLATHIHLHAAAQKRYSGVRSKTKVVSGKMSKLAMTGLIESLEKAVRSQRWVPGGTEWGQYYQATNYSEIAREEKRAIVSDWLQQVKPSSVWDLGANTGLYSRISSDLGIYTVAGDIDPAAVELNYLDMRKNKEKNLFPMVLDLTNPSSNIGWANQERQSLTDRGPAGMVMALALVHHLAISNNVPLPTIAGYFSSLAEWLIVEFVPKTDTQVQRLLSSRMDIFPSYSREGFAAAFNQYYEIKVSIPMQGSERWLYLMQRSMK
jgi:ribosomal protein L11 methylase PrmA